MPEYCGVISVNPTTRARLDRVEAEEAKFDMAILERAIAGARRTRIDRLDEEELSRVDVEVLSVPLADATVTSMLEDHHGRLWLGSRDLGAGRLAVLDICQPEAAAPQQFLVADDGGGEPRYVVVGALGIQPAVDQRALVGELAARGGAGGDQGAEKSDQRLFHGRRTCSVVYFWCRGGAPHCILNHGRLESTPRTRTPLLDGLPRGDRAAARRQRPQLEALDQDRVGVLPGARAAQASGCESH